jgi:hypothetical protein
MMKRDLLEPGEALEHPRLREIIDFGEPEESVVRREAGQYS